MLNKTAAQNPPTSKPLIILEANKTNNPLITKVNRPRVKILIGKVTKTKIGLMTALIKPKISAIHNEAQKLAT